MSEHTEVRYHYYQGRYSATNWEEMKEVHLEAAVRMFYTDMAYHSVIPIGQVQRKIFYLAWRELTDETQVGGLSEADTVRVEMRVVVKPLRIEDLGPVVQSWGAVR